jgi:hypothetical protein
VSASLGNVFSSEVQPPGEKSAITEDEKIFQYYPLKIHDFKRENQLPIENSTYL